MLLGKLGHDALWCKVRTTANLADSLLELRNAVQILYKLGALGAVHRDESVNHF